MDFNVVPEYFEVVILFLPNNRFITEDFPTFETPSTTAFTFLSGKILFIFLITPFIPYLLFALINAIFSGTISSSASLSFIQSAISVGCTNPGNKSVLFTRTIDL